MADKKTIGTIGERNGFSVKIYKDEYSSVGLKNDTPRKLAQKEIRDKLGLKPRKKVSIATESKELSPEQKEQVLNFIKKMKA